MFLLSLTTKSQNTAIDRMAILDSLKNPHLADSVYKFVDESPSFPNGDYGWSRFLTKNLQYPQAAQVSDIQGSVTVRFIVEKKWQYVVPFTDKRTGSFLRRSHQTHKKESLEAG